MCCRDGSRTRSFSILCIPPTPHGTLYPAKRDPCTGCASAWTSRPSEGHGLPWLASALRLVSKFIMSKSRFESWRGAESNRHIFLSVLTLPRISPLAAYGLSICPSFRAVITKSLKVRLTGSCFPSAYTIFLSFLFAPQPSLTLMLFLVKVANFFFLLFSVNHPLGCLVFTDLLLTLLLTWCKDKGYPLMWQGFSLIFHKE